MDKSAPCSRSAPRPLASALPGATPAGAWCFMPRTDPLVCAALEIDMVRARICEDLAIRISEELAR